MYLYPNKIFKKEKSEDKKSKKDKNKRDKKDEENVKPAILSDKLRINEELLKDVFRHYIESLDENNIVLIGNIFNSYVENFATVDYFDDLLMWLLREFIMVPRDQYQSTKRNGRRNRNTYEKTSVVGCCLKHFRNKKDYLVKIFDLLHKSDEFGLELIFYFLDRFKFSEVSSNDYLNEYKSDIDIAFKGDEDVYVEENKNDDNKVEICNQIISEYCMYLSDKLTQINDSFIKNNEGKAKGKRKGKGQAQGKGEERKIVKKCMRLMEPIGKELSIYENNVELNKDNNKYSRINECLISNTRHKYNEYYHNLEHILKNKKEEESTAYIDSLKSFQNMQKSRIKHIRLNKK